MRAMAWPLAIALVTAVGLTSALLADGAWDALSWALLGAPAALSCWVLFPRSD